MAVRRERGHTFPKSLDVMGVEIAVFKYLSSPANPTKACSFRLPSLPAGGTVPLSWMSTAPSLCSGASSVPPSKPFFIFCLLHLHSLPLSGFCFSLYQVHIKYTHVLGKRSLTGHTFNNINRWSRVSLKFNTQQQALRLGKCVCVCVCVLIN